MSGFASRLGCEVMGRVCKRGRRRVQLVLDVHSFCVCVRERERERENSDFALIEGVGRGEKMFSEHL